MNAYVAACCRATKGRLAGLRTRFPSALFLSTLALSIVASSSSSLAQTLDVLDDVTILINANLGEEAGNETGNTEDNTGDRAELIVNSFLKEIDGVRQATDRRALLRFDVSSFASQINDPTMVLTSASLTLRPRAGREGFNSNPPRSLTLGVYPLVSENEGWVEGTSNGGAGGLNGELGRASLAFHTNPTGATGNTVDPSDDGRFWHSAGGGPTPDPFEPIVESQLFQLGVDTTSSPIGTRNLVDLDTDNSDGLDDFVFDLDPALLDPILAEWLDAPDITFTDADDALVTQTGNAGLAIASILGTPLPTDNDQIFFESSEGLAGAGPRLSLTFGPAPAGLDGDYNDDDAVNAADFTVFRDAAGSDATLPGDTTPGVVDGVDFDVWAANFGALAAGSVGVSAVPEPSAAALLVLGSLLILKAPRSAGRR